MIPSHGPVASAPCLTPLLSSNSLTIQVLSFDDGNGSEDENEKENKNMNTPPAGYGDQIFGTMGFPGESHHNNNPGYVISKWISLFNAPNPLLLRQPLEPGALPVF